jgi:hypothetical protein
MLKNDWPIEGGEDLVLTLNWLGTEGPVQANTDGIRGGVLIGFDAACSASVDTGALDELNIGGAYLPQLPALSPGKPGRMTSIRQHRKIRTLTD